MGYAGRQKGKDGYKFGDLSRGLVRKMTRTNAVKPPASVGETRPDLRVELANLESHADTLSQQLVEARQQTQTAYHFGAVLAICLMVVLDLVIDDSDYRRCAHMIVLAVIVV